MPSLANLAAALFFATASCSSPTPGFDSEGQDRLTGVTGSERPITFASYVYAAPSASDQDIAAAIARQVKTALGALRTPKVSLDDRNALHNVDASQWKRTTLSVVDPSNVNATATKIVRVDFTYVDRAVVTNGLKNASTVSFTMLGGDYTLHADALKQNCSDDTTTAADSLWYHFDPSSANCQSLIGNELNAITTERAQQKQDPAKVGPKEVARWFVPTTAKLGPIKALLTDYSPEYDRLYGIGTDKSQLVVYAFFGVDADETNPDDPLAQEYIRFLRTLLIDQPNFKVTNTNPFAMLMDVWVDGQKLTAPDYATMFGWLLDKTGYPQSVGHDAGKIAQLRRGALANLAERWIYWDMPLTVSDANHAAKAMTVQVRSYFGYEDGSQDARQHAQWRYLEAFWHGDVFLYNGHSHFGHGPLEPTLYGPQNFNDRYQIMMVNSCISFNYYHEDFFGYKPGGTKNLDMIVNGLPSYVWGGGIVTAKLVTGLVSGKQPTYKEILGGMVLDTPWGEHGYDPMRVVDGELDNVYSRTKSPLTLR